MILCKIKILEPFGKKMSEEFNNNSGDKVLTFYFDYLSPYAFLGWKNIQPLLKKYNLILKPEPVLFGAILTHLETKGPAEIKPKREYIFKEVMRIAVKRGINLQFPPEHPFNPLPSSRATCLMENHKNYHDFIDYMFDTCWIDGKDIAKTEIVIKILEKFGIENASEKINDIEIKALLKEKTDKAILKGVFGVPSMLINNELFWGDSSIPFIEDYLTDGDKFDKAKLTEFLNRPRGIDRKI